MKQIGVKNVKLSEYEMSIAAHLVDPLNMHVRIFHLTFLNVFLFWDGGCLSVCVKRSGRWMSAGL